MGWVLGLGHWEGPCSMFFPLVSFHFHLTPFRFLFAMNADLIE